jgi:hypothetical protein
VSLLIHTSQYRYSGSDRLDVTGKSKDPYGVVFEPTWDMVWAWKDGKCTWSQYRRAYRELLFKSEKASPEEWRNVLSRDHVVLVCFCAAFGHCHRYELAHWFVIRYNATYAGEISTKPPFEILMKPVTFF